ncbi:MAG TPA: hypothetical protein PK771_13825 [Spirochaetota bacterium]|nr:hypothetical protein [Spirochaetota bacterium]
MRYKVVILMIVIFFLISSCATVVKTYKNNSSNKKELTKLEIKKDSKGKEWMELSSKLIHPIFLSGNFRVDNTGDIEFDINAIKFLTNWENGWTEGEGSVNAKLIFYKENDYYKCKVIENYEFFEITKGSLRFQDDFYYDEKGLNSVKNKFDRIIAVNEFLRTQKEFPDFFYTSLFKSKSGESYKQKVEKILFPEVFPDSVLYKTKEYETKDVSNDLSIAETVVWNKLYTKKIFPENLQMIRDSGTMYRDFEETIELFYAEYNLKYFFEKFINEQKFYIEIKK